MAFKISEERLTKRQKKWIGAAILLLLALFCGLITWFIGRPMVKLASRPEAFRALVKSHGMWGRAIFVGMMIFQVIIAFVPGEPLEIGAGYAFGAIEGTILCMIGTVVGSMLVFLLVKRFGIRLVEIFFDLEKVRNLKFLHNAKKLNVIVFFAFFLPGTPKDLLTYAVGLTEMDLKTFLLITSIARLPSVITSTVGGNALGGQRYWFAIIVFGATLLLSGLGLWIYQKHVNKKKD